MDRGSAGRDFAAETAERVERMRRTPAELAAHLAGPLGHMADKRPAPDAWSATEVICHLRDIEEAYFGRIQLILANGAPMLVQIDPDRWVLERQYARSDAIAALAAFRARRDETLAFLASLAAHHWDRTGDHPSRGPLSIRKIVHSLAKHDGEHLDQIARALDGLA